MSLPYELGRSTEKDNAYIKKYGEREFFEDLARYERLVREDWTTVLNREDSNLEQFHKKALEVLRKV